MNLTFSRQHGAKGKEKPTNFEAKIKAGTKIHTIRDDVHDRWKPGMPIHFWIGTPRVPATKAERIFMQMQYCKFWKLTCQLCTAEIGNVIPKHWLKNYTGFWDTQMIYDEIAIPVCAATEKILIYQLQTEFPVIQIGRKVLTAAETVLLANNDGFETVEDFFNWFRKPTVEKWWNEVKGKYTNKKTLPTEFEGKIIHWTDFVYDAETAERLTI